MVGAVATGALGMPRWGGHNSTRKGLSLKLSACRHVWNCQEVSPCSEPHLPPYTSRLSTSSASCGDVQSLPHDSCKLMVTAGVWPGLFQGKHPLFPQSYHTWQSFQSSLLDTIQIPTSTSRPAHKNWMCYAQNKGRWRSLLPSCRRYSPTVLIQQKTALVARLHINS